MIDEVHSYDAHMGVFLHELLRWCGRLETPVILMSATLAPRLRAELIRSWRQGASLPEWSEAAQVGRYPLVTACFADGRVEVEASAGRRASQEVTLEVLESQDPEDVDLIAAAIAQDLSTGGCGLAILNTVKRAQQVYVALRDRGVPCQLLHSRLTAAERARRNAWALQQIGSGGERPEQMVIVATQVAEQSFDVDADVLYTDVAPVDLLLQRIGRLHRHDGTRRPERLRRPRAVVTGLRPGPMPAWPRAFASAPEDDVRTDRRVRTVYRPGPLLATASLLATKRSIRIPDQIPELVAAAYAPQWSGADWLAGLAQQAQVHESAERELTERRAETFRLDRDPEHTGETLAGLHGGGAVETPVDSVRDGDDSVEVCLLRSRGDMLTTLGGRPLGQHGERAMDSSIADEVAGDVVRMRWRHELEELQPFAPWRGVHGLENLLVAVVDEDGAGHIGAYEFRYDDELGLVDR